MCGDSDMRVKLGITVGLLLLILSVLLHPVISFAGPKPAAVGKSDKCQVCGMFVAKYPSWIAQIVFKDGTTAFFDGPKDMFRYYFNLQKYNPSKKQSDITAIYVTEYYSAKLTDAKNVLFVLGSDVFGPMGNELIPVGSSDNAKEFMNDHNGRKLLKFREVTPEVLN